MLDRSAGQRARMRYLVAPMKLVALCAAYGSCGRAVGSGVADMLEVPFLDRAIPAAVADRLDVSIEAVARFDEVGSGWVEHGLRGFLGLEMGLAIAPLAEELTAEDFHQVAEQLMLRQADSGAGVILGRAAVALLRGDPRVLRVRLNGPQRRRAARAERLHGADPKSFTRAARRFDRGQTNYMSRNYGVDIRDPSLYHLTVDPRAVGVEASIALIATAARALREDTSAPPRPGVRRHAARIPRVKLRPDAARLPGLPAALPEPA